MKYGYKPDLLDQRDKFYSPKSTGLTRVDLRPFDTPIYDQGDLGSCTANAIAGHLDFNRKKQGESIIKPSRLFIYWNERNLEGTVDSDSGASIRDSVKVVKTFGAPMEKNWAYNISKFKIKPDSEAYSQALLYEDLTYLRVKQTPTSFESCLSEGFPLVIGVSVYESFESVGKSGIVPLPSINEKLLGGHALMVVGFDIAKDWFIVRNSWGNWGKSGYCFIPYEYLMNPKLASDFWTLRSVR